MWGAIIGDLAGSIYEFEQTKSIVPVSVNNIIETNAFYSDDTILTIAVADAILNDKDYGKYLRYYIIMKSEGNNLLMILTCLLFIFLAHHKGF